MAIAMATPESAWFTCVCSPPICDCKPLATLLS